MTEQTIELETLSFSIHGAQRIDAALKPLELRALTAALAHLPPDEAGIRLHGIDALTPFLSPQNAIGKIAAQALGRDGLPVRAILFDKTAATNWALPWHQDRTVAVKARIDVEGFGPWTVKGGLLHVAPPFEVLAKMVTLRVHFDPVPATNAPLLVAPGSHRLGRIPETNIPSVVQRCGSVACLAKAGDIWLYATPILHASEAATAPTHRRVLQMDFAAEALPGGLEWLGV